MNLIELGWGDGRKPERAMVERLDILNDNMVRQNALLLRIAVALEGLNFK